MNEHVARSFRPQAEVSSQIAPSTDSRRRSGAIRPIQEVKPSPLRVIFKRLAGRKIVEMIRERRNLKYHHDELNDKGWQKSLISGESIDYNGPVPWVTYPALKFIERLVSPQLKVFEYGCGNSSLWWSSKAASVVSVEHDARWAENVANRAPPHLRVVLRQMNDAADPNLLRMADEFFARNPDLPTSGYPEHDADSGLLCREFTAYATEIGRYGPGYFDGVVIDGMARGLSTWMAVNYIKDSGFIIFDNSDRWQYNCAYRILSEFGFKRIDLHGLGPGRAIEWCTTVYLRNLDAVPRAGELPVGQEADLGW
ncbi:MAG: hypothetical protein QOF70_6886 [Acetobacteraceae bacterium]|jgi:hypothetical protein|nr:hypothetical protein [Acetobacteraceae bacterium]